MGVHPVEFCFSDSNGFLPGRLDERRCTLRRLRALLVSAERLDLGHEAVHKSDT